MTLSIQSRVLEQGNGLKGLEIDTEMRDLVWSSPCISRPSKMIRPEDRDKSTPDQHVEGRRFTCSVGADETKDFSALERRNWLHTHGGDAAEFP